jgi:class 3 adenylate cyclase
MSAGIKARDEVIEGKNRAYAQLLKRIFPDTVADRLKQGEANIAESFNQVTVIYAIVEGLAAASHDMGSENATRVLNDLVDAFDNAADRTGVEKVKTIGDHYLAVCGLDVARLDHAKRSLDFASAIYRVIQVANQTHNFELQLRVGIATGPVQAGLVGNRRFVYDIWGLAASVARRIVYEADLDALRMNVDTYNAIADKTGISEASEVKTKALGVLKTYQYRFSSDPVGEADKMAAAPKAAE